MQKPTDARDGDRVLMAPGSATELKGTARPQPSGTRNSHITQQAEALAEYIERGGSAPDWLRSKHFSIATASDILRDLPSARRRIAAARERCRAAISAAMQRMRNQDSEDMC